VDWKRRLNDDVCERVHSVVSLVIQNDSNPRFATVVTKVPLETGIKIHCIHLITLSSKKKKNHRFKISIYNINSVQLNQNLTKLTCDVLSLFLSLFIVFLSTD